MSRDISLKEKEIIYHAIEECQCGELYRFLGVKKDSTIDVINRTYKDIIKNFDENNEEDSFTIESLKAAMTVISNKRLRSYYNQYIYDEMVEFENEYYKKKQENHYRIILILESIATPFQFSSFVVNISQSSDSPIKILIDFFKNTNRYSLFKIIFSQFLIPPTIEFINRNIFKVNDKLTYSFSTPGKLLDLFTPLISSFIIIFPLECYFVSAVTSSSSSLSFYQVFKKVVLGQDSITGKFKLKNLSYAFLTNLAWYTINSTVRMGVKKLEGYVEKKHLENPQSTFWKYSLNIRKPFIGSFISTLLLSPFDTIRSQYTYLYVQRYLGKPVGSLLNNPISIALNIVKSYGYKKLYNTIFFNYAVYLISDFMTFILNSNQFIN
ncbi:hypothetical protein ACTFIV_005033 [Dictyostelium citrinum]